MILAILARFSLQIHVPIGRFHPEEEGNEYKLTKYTPIKYPSLAECYKNEILTTPNVNHADLQTKFNDISTNEFYKNLLQKDQTPYLVDPNNKLTADEILAVFIYTIYDDFCENFTQQLSLGETGHYNCYFEYLYSGIQKINPKYNGYESDTLYLGGRYETPEHEEQYAKLIAGDTIISQGISSTTFSLFACISLFAQENDYIFKIKHKFKNSRIIQWISRFVDEAELLFLPETKFKVTSPRKDVYCSQRSEDCIETYEEGRKHLYMIEVEELDEDIQPYREIENPFTYDSIAIPTRAPSWILSIIMFVGVFLIVT
ncbi:hypothetical protein GPJ56_010181 [Histomonas meleagridis]|uniref:uncharacterized protein n=1 Tax=Histomonas meleagridis TaxID=135588 RepID=UPI00355937E6|nr:hypothetical protein GPJ56_010181 [Histomonas meleagridis]KAH0804717.1 hypothetical protein GO595_002411 [Histomonas meleagridis]